MTGGQSGGDRGRGGAGGGGGGGISATGGSGGGATGGAPAAGGAGGSIGRDPTEVCRSAIQVQSERFATCLGSDLADYLRAANACPGYVFSPDSNHTVDDVVNCLPALAARTCTDVVLAIMPACYPYGKRDSQAGCAFSSQCQSGVCNGGGTGCGVCSDGGKPVGRACSSWFECAVGLHCTSGGSCADNGKPVYATEGQPCDLDATPIVGCVGDLYCKMGGVGRIGTCTAPPGAGEPCASSVMINGINAIAICAAGTTCVQGTCQPPGGCSPGLVCDSGSYCASTGTGLACAPRATVGQACSGGTDGHPCLAPAICLDYSKCVVPRAAGEACDTDNPCDGYLVCQSGTCQKMEAAMCPV